MRVKYAKKIVKFAREFFFCFSGAPTFAREYRNLKKRSKALFFNFCVLKLV